jgi:hypothetical protein
MEACVFLLRHLLNTNRQVHNSRNSVVTFSKRIPKEIISAMFTAHFCLKNQQIFNENVITKNTSMSLKFTLLLF